MNSNDTTTTTTEFMIQRTYDVPRGVIFEALSRCEHLAKWWGPSAFPIFRCEIDLRPGGRLLYGMRREDGMEMWGRWTFEEVSSPSVLQFLMCFSDPEGGVTRHPFAPTWPETMRCRIELKEEDARTTLTLRARPVDPNVEEAKTFEDHRGSLNNGFGETFSQLVTYLDGGALDLARRSISNSRVFDAPVELVYRVFTSPEHVTHWWGPYGFSTTTVEHQLAPGGVWRFTMHGPDGTDYLNRVDYEEVVPEQTLVYRHRGEGAHDHIQFHVTVQFEPVDGNKTRIRMTNVFPTKEIRDQLAKDVGAEEGLAQTLSRLGEYLDAVNS